MDEESVRDDSNQPLVDNPGKGKFFNTSLWFFLQGLILEVLFSLEFGFSNVGIFLHFICLGNMLLFGYLWLENAKLSPIWLTKSFKKFFQLFDTLMNLSVSAIIWIFALIFASVGAYFIFQGLVLIPLQIIVVLLIIVIINKDQSR